jgi:hypothetical protein
LDNLAADSTLTWREHMRTTMPVSVMAALAATLFAAMPAKAQPAAWVELGCQRVNFGLDRDVVRIGRSEGGFRAIRLRARGNNINVLDVKVVYGNGEPDDIPVRAVIRAGSSTAAKDLRGVDRGIDRVELIYRSQPNFRGEGLICVDGMRVAGGGGAGPGPGAGWVELGCQRVNFGLDRDVIRIARRDGTFKAIRLRARGNNINVLDVKVVYGNGRADDIPVRAVIQAGSSTEPKDLRGFDRFIERVELIYRSQPNFRGEGLICVDGRG